MTTVLVAFCLAFNAFFVLAEFSLVRVRATRIEELARQGNRRALLVRRILGSLDTYLSAIQVGITMASLGLGWVGEPAVARLLKPWLQWPSLWSEVTTHSVAFGLAFVLITFLHVVLGELVPKSLAIQSCEAAALWAARPLELFYGSIYAPLRFFDLTARAILKLFRMQPGPSFSASYSEEELRMILSLARTTGVIPPRRFALFENAFLLARKTVRDLMVPRERVAYLSLAHPWPKSFEVLRQHRHSRYPICLSDNLNHVVGMVHLKDIALESVSLDKPLDLEHFKHDILVVPERWPAERLLEEFQRKRVHMAVVQDTKGTITGLVTIEDVLESLVGRIDDEFDQIRQLKLSECLERGAILPSLQAADRHEAIVTLVQAVQHAGLKDPTKATHIVWSREQGHPTGIGQGVAVPHGLVPGLTQPVVALGHSGPGIDFGAPDGKRCHWIFLILFPKHLSGTHVRLLGQIAALLKSEMARAQLEQATDGPALLAVIRRFEGWHSPS